MARGEGPEPDPARVIPGLALNPFHAGWAVAAANGRLVPKGSVRWLTGGGMKVPVTHRTMLGRLPLPHDAALAHEHCFSGQFDVPAGGELSVLSHLLASSSRPLLFLPKVPDDTAVRHALYSLPGAVVVQTRRRAMLRSTTTYDDYVSASIRSKKRKEFRRLHARLAEAGELTETVSDGSEGLADWTAAFLRIEAAGWKGRSGTAMAERSSERAYLTLLLEGARDAGALRLFTLRVDDEPIAMVVGLLGSDGGLYTYKIAHDPAWDRYSPGVMLMLFVTRHVLGSGEISYADSCAREGHGMIEQLWAERRTLHDWLVPTGAIGRAMTAALLTVGKARRP